MFNQLQNHLNTHKILTEEQFDSRSDLTTNNAIYKVVNETLSALNNKLMVGGIFYLEKAFVRLNHNILL